MPAWRRCARARRSWPCWSTLWATRAGGVRKEAVVRAAGWADHDRAAAVLVATLAEPENVGRRNAAVEALARMGGPAVAPLVAALAERLDHRKLIVDTLGLIGDRRAADPLLPSLDDPDPNVRAATAEALGMIGGAAAERALLAALERGELLLSLACLAALSGLGAVLPRQRLEPLLDTPVLRPAVLTSLGATRDVKAAPLLVRYLGDQSRVVREAATLGLDALRASLDDAGRAAMCAQMPSVPEEARRLLVQALLEGAPATRRAAATVLGLYGGISAVRPLVLALGDAEVEEAAAQALGQLPVEVAGTLAAMAGQVDATLRIAIFRIVPSLHGAGDGRVQGALEAALTEDDAEVAAQAVRALGAAGGSNAVAAVLRALGREDLGAAAEEALAALSTRFGAQVREAVLARGFDGADARHLCRALGVCGLPEDAAVLERLLDDERAPLRAAAAESLALLAGEQASEDVFGRIAAALSDASPEVRASAARALVAWPRARGPLEARERLEEDPLVRAVLAAALAQPAPRGVKMLKPAATEPRLSDEEFRLLRALIRDHCGIDFESDSRFLLERRLVPRLVSLHMRSFTEYYLYLRYTADRRAELDEIADRVTTNETYFFRERYQLDAFQIEILPEIKGARRPRRLHVWSAGCSSGEEAYTIAMLIHETGWFDSWDVRVFGSDVSRKVLGAARRGIYGKASFRAIEEHHQRTFFQPADDRLQVRADIRNLVTFGHMNLLDDDSVAAVGEMDIIFCRNVLIYFDIPSRRKVIETFHRKLARGGYLLLGHSESLVNLSTAFELVHLERDMVYRKP